MEQTAEQQAWQCGHAIGLKDGRRALDGATIGLAAASTAPGVPRKVRAAFLNGYGHGIADATRAIPAPIPVAELAELNPGMGPGELHRLQAMEQLLAEDDLAQGIEPE